MWIMLLLIAKKNPAKPMVVFIIGWFAECAGNVWDISWHRFVRTFDHFVAVVLMFIVLTVGLMFSEGQFVLDFDIEADESSVHVEETPLKIRATPFANSSTTGCRPENRKYAKCGSQAMD